MEELKESVNDHLSSNHRKSSPEEDIVEDEMPTPNEGFEPEIESESIRDEVISKNPTPLAHEEEEIQIDIPE